jgi:hypothetical protein
MQIPSSTREISYARARAMRKVMEACQAKSVVLREAKRPEHDVAPTATVVDKKSAQGYDEFCRERVREHLKKLGNETRNRMLAEVKSQIRRQFPQLARDTLDEMTQDHLERNIRRELRLPSLEEYSASL